MNNLNQNKMKKPENVKMHSQKINVIPQKHNNSTKNEHINKHTNDNINKNKSKMNNNINNNHYSSDSKIDRIKNSFENRDGKILHPENMRNNFDYNKHKQISSKRHFFENDDYDEDDPFIDNTDYQNDNNKELMHVLYKFKNFQDMRKKYEAKGDIEVANYDTIQEEEDRTRRIGRQEDLEALIENRRLEENEEDEDDDDY